MQIAKIAFFTIFIYLLILLWFIYYNKIEINLYGDEFTDDSQKNNFSKKINQTSIFKGPVLDVQKEYLKKKVEYQMRCLGTCSFSWNNEEEKLEFSKEYYKNKPQPELFSI